MKKRTVLLAGLAAAMMMAVPALAEEETACVYVGGFPLTAGDFVVNGAETVEEGSLPESGYAALSADGKTLTLNGYEYSGKGHTYGSYDYTSAIYTEQNLTIHLIGDNKIGGTKEGITGYGNDGSITITGEGSLAIDAECGIYTWDTDLIISGGTIDIETDAYIGIYVDDISITDSNLTIESYGDCIRSDGGSITIENSTLNLLTDEYSGIYAGDISITDSDLTINSNGHCIVSYYDITIENSTLDLNAGYNIYECMCAECENTCYMYADGIYTYEGNIIIENCTGSIRSQNACIYAYSTGNIEITNSILTLDAVRETDEDGDYLPYDYYDYDYDPICYDCYMNCYDGDEECKDDIDWEGIMTDNGSISIDNSNLTIHSYGNCIQSDSTDVEVGISITGSTLDLISDDEECIDDEDGILIIDNCKIIAVAADSCLEDDDHSIVITNTSLDLTTTDTDLVISAADDVSLDSKVVLYGENGKRLTNTPVAFSVLENVYEEEYHEDGSYSSYSYLAYNGTPVYRLVTAADTSIYIEKTLGSLKTVSFSGDGAEALDGLVRAFGSTINLTKIVPAAREGYTFTGWYADPACTKPITKLVVTGNMEIYAGWELIPVEEEETAEETAETAVEAAAE